MRGAPNLLSDYVMVGVDLKPGPRVLPASRRKARPSGTARIWTCDFTADYVNITASYRT